MTMFLLNGEKADSINLQDRGLQYGDGLFETIAVRNRQLEFWQRHMQRLQQGCRRLAIPEPDVELLLTETQQLLTNTESAVLKIIITRGQGGRGYRAPEPSACQPSRIISIHDWPDYPESNQQHGIIARYCETHLSSSPSLAGIKHLNRLEQVLARNEWHDEAIFEGLMLSAHGRVVEGTMSNLFFVKEGVLCSPDLSNTGVAGIMRDVILLQTHKLQIPVKIGNFKTNDIESADELFISNSLIGIFPIHQLEQHSFAVGPITQQLISAVNDVRMNDTTHAAL